MSKYKEFYIYEHTKDKFSEIRAHYRQDSYGTLDEEYHVIEHSALTDLQQQNKELQDKLNQVLKVCKGHEDLMWSAKIISIILDCDFRDGKSVIAETGSKL